MKNIAKAFILALAVCMLAAPFAARAADPVSVAVVDVQLLMTESSAGKDIQQQLESRKTSFLSQIGKEEQKLREDEKALAGQRSSLGADEFAKKAKEFEERLTNSRRQAQERKKALEEAAAKALGKLRDEVLKVVQGISNEKGYTLVVNRQNVVVSSKSFDITDEALEKLNKQIKKVPLEIADK